MFFWLFVERKKNAKCEKVFLVSIFIVFCKGRHVEKKAWTLQKRDKKNELLIKKVATIDEKNEEKGVGNKS